MASAMGRDGVGAEVRAALAPEVLRAQCRRVLRPAVATVAAVTALAVVIGACCLVFDLPIYHFTADPTTVPGELHPYTGMVSTFGLFGWAAAAAACALAAMVLHERRAPAPEIRLLVCSSALSLGLGLDDAFLLHEDVLPTHLGVPELVVFGAYGALAVLYLRGCLPQILRSEHLLLLVSSCALATSVLMDAVVPFSGPASFVEDMAKFGGIAFWALWCLRTTAGLLRGEEATTVAEREAVAAFR